MDIGTAFVAHSEMAVEAEPGECALDHPAVATLPEVGGSTRQVGAAIYASSGDVREDALSLAGCSAAGKVISLICVPLDDSAIPFGSPSRPAAALARRRDGLDHALEVLDIVGIRRAERERQGNAADVGQNVAFCPRPSAVHWVDALASPTGRARSLHPLFAGMLILTSAARLQSMALAWPRRSSRTWCRPSQMFAVLPIPHTTPAGHFRTAAHLGRQHIPRDADLQHKQDGRQRGPVRHRQPPALWAGQQRLDHRP